MGAYPEEHEAGQSSDCPPDRSCFKTVLTKSEVGITEQKKAPGFKKAMSDFLAWSLSEHPAHPATHARYKVSAVALRKHFGDVHLDRITP
jgi:hypothetical protein